MLHENVICSGAGRVKFSNNLNRIHIIEYFSIEN
jgi:hypothetical protein